MVVQLLKIMRQSISWLRVNHQAFSLYNSDLVLPFFFYSTVVNIARAFYIVYLELEEAIIHTCGRLKQVHARIILHCLKI